MKICKVRCHCDCKLSRTLISSKADEQTTLNLRKMLISRSRRHMNVLCPLNLVFLSTVYDQIIV